MRLTRDEIVAAYLLDRADQYEADSPCWIALADAAANVINGEHKQAHVENEFDAGLVKRVRSMRGRPPRSVDPWLGVDGEEDA
jgi:hypothetical protein